MPFYEYQCRQCGHHLEILQKISDGPLKKCPSCGRAQLARIMSRVAFRLKGGGWYETDFKSDGEQKRNLVGEEAAPAETKAAEPASADGAAKPEAKAAPADTAAPAQPASPGGARARQKSAPAKAKAKAKAAPRAKPAAKSKSKAARR